MVSAEEMQKYIKDTEKELKIKLEMQKYIHNEIEYLQRILDAHNELSNN